ncbi:MAG: LuxR C-terminal-related transcriptional regulator [bacterium]|nr:LuxR C-terminal-related transcriptional regulator [bacterium]
MPPKDPPKSDPSLASLSLPDFALMAEWAAMCSSRAEMMRLISHLQPPLGFEGWQISWVLSNKQGEEELLQVSQLPQGWSERQRSLDFFVIDDYLTQQLKRPRAWGVQVWENRNFVKEPLLRPKPKKNEGPGEEESAFNAEELQSLRRGFSCGLMGALEQSMLFWAYGARLDLGGGARRILQQATPILYVAAERLWAAQRKNYLPYGQYRVLELQSLGLSKQEVAEDMGISPSTVSYHLTRAYDTLDAHNTNNAIYKASRLGLFNDTDS